MSSSAVDIFPSSVSSLPSRETSAAFRSTISPSFTVILFPRDVSAACRSVMAPSAVVTLPLSPEMSVVFVEMFPVLISISALLAEYWPLTASPAVGYVMPLAPTLMSWSSASPVVLPSVRDANVSILCSRTSMRPSMDASNSVSRGSISAARVPSSTMAFSLLLISVWTFRSSK